MPLKLEELKRLHDKAYLNSETTRENASNDLTFYWVTQWNGDVLEESQLAYRGEFNILRKAGRQIQSDLMANPVQVDFEPIDEDREDSAEVIDGLYRTDDNNNSSQFSYDFAKQEMIVAGFGAWELYTEYKTMRGAEKHQVIKRSPVFEATNTAYCDPNAKMLDKSDSDYWSILIAYTEDGYKKLVTDLTGEEDPEVNPSSFSMPEESYAFPWISGGTQKIYITRFYHREKVMSKLLTLTDPFDQTMDVWEDSLEKVMDEMLDSGWEITDEKKVERYQITRYIASGERILDISVIPGQELPIVPCYGEYARIEGEEHYEGVTRIAKDPQRLRNFQLSYLADITSRSPRQKPIFTPEQIAGFQHMYEQSGADNNYPYLLQNSRDANGNPLPVGPVAVMPEQPMPAALVQSIALTRQAVEDVANPGLPQDIADPDISGKAVLALQARLDMQSMVYQNHFKYAKRRDAVIYASMAAEIYDVPRKVTLTLPDGSKKQVKMMESIVDRQTGDIVTINDINNAEFEVYSKIGPDYSSQKEQTVDRIEKMISQIEPGDPMRKALQLKQLRLIDGVDFDDIRDYANKQLVMMGIKKPETDEEIQMVQQAQQQGQKPDAAMLLAQAEIMKGKADLIREQREGMQFQMQMQQKQAENQIDGFDAQTKRMKVQVDAQKAGADINMKNIESFGKQLDNTEKILNLKDFEKMSNDDLVEQLMAG